MALINRNTLKNYFKKGGFAKENHFVDLIDSTLNSVDDGIEINKKDGLKLSTSPFSTKLISFFKKPTQENPEFSLGLNKDDVEGLSISDKNKKTIIKIDKNGLIGVNKVKPDFDFDLKGTLAYESKIGNYIKGSV